jgi:hypothetical protein
MESHVKENNQRKNTPVIKQYGAGINVAAHDEVETATFLHVATQTFTPVELQQFFFTETYILAQAISCRPLTEKALIQSQASTCGVCGEFSDTGAAFSRSKR